MKQVSLKEIEFSFSSILKQITHTLLRKNNNNLKGEASVDGDQPVATFFLFSLSRDLEDFQPKAENKSSMNGSRRRRAPFKAIWTIFVQHNSPVEMVTSSNGEGVKIMDMMSARL